MLTKIVVIVSCLYVVQAGFIFNAPGQDNNNQNAELAEDFDISESVGQEDGNAFASARACTNTACFRFCVSRGYIRGLCVSANVCRCYRWIFALSENESPAEVAVDVIKDDNDDVKAVEAENQEIAEDFNIGDVAAEGQSEASNVFAEARACTHSACHSFCRSRGYLRGHCVSANVCRCYRWLSAITENDAPAELAVDINRDDNDDVNLIQTGNPELVEDFNIGAVASEGHSEAGNILAAARACTHSGCHAFCRSRGYLRGHCVSASVCRCYRWIFALSENADQAETAVDINKVDKVDDEVINKINVINAVAKKKQELNLEEASARACNNTSCNRSCRAKGFTRGYCRNASTCLCLMENVPARF